MDDDIRYRVVERIRSCSKFHFTDEYPCQYFMEIFVGGEYMVLNFRSRILSRYSGEWEDILIDHFLQNPKSRVFVNMEMRLSNLEKLGL